ncbi:hypothetical protein [Desulfosarcina ovata]|uniref:Uncharacterized protein n=1 Tax=Desulfosarcina ovata subsp. ovata TaxID=2752305 RepID=A0A5K8ADF4_9BACT|nr:hypothetical protein [Desulfosarcina ovata]BBO89970.1 hypothetical protein DSCOOX_31500 [Desulfosarcina ovata subsp. ovata]
MPEINFFLASTADSIGSGHPLWRCPLPENREAAASTPSSTAITYQDYFSAVSSFCLADDARRLLAAASRCLERPVSLAELSDISVFLVKHGAFYHPSRLQVDVAGRPLAFVLNVAASADGLASLPLEIQALSRLNAQRPFGWLPEIYDHATMTLPAGKPIAMFLGSWFNGYHEFHLTRSPGHDDDAIGVWDGATVPRQLTADQTADLYREATMILTACYDPITTRHIFPWHHAAGDFVVNPSKNRPSVRLITVRGLPPITDLAPEAMDEAAILESLFVFFIHTSLRMRLDRLDGVGAVAWVPDACLIPMIEGFFQGLDLTARLSGFPESFPAFFQDYFNQCAKVDLLVRAKRAAAPLFRQASEEWRVIQGHIDRHVTDIRRAVAEFVPLI